MTEGAWVAISVMAGGGFGTIIAAILKFVPKHSNDTSIPDPKKCPAHSGLIVEINSLHDGIKRLEKGQDEIWTGVNEIRDDIKQFILDK